MTLNEQMQLADKFALVNNHAWRPAHYLMIGTDAREHIDSAGMVMIEMLAGKYQVCRVEPFFYPAHVCGFTGDKVEAYTDFQPKYYGEFTHNQLAKAFKLAATIAATPITTTTIEI